MTTRRVFERGVARALAMEGRVPVTARKYPSCTRRVSDKRLPLCARPKTRCCGRPRMRLRLPRLLLAAALLAAGPAPAADSIVEAVKGGKLGLLLNYRYEYVDDDAPQRLEDAHAQTLRAVLGYESGLFHGFGVTVDVEGIAGLQTDYNDGSNRKPQYAVVADPTQLDFLNGHLRHQGLPGTTIRLGRQAIAQRAAPWHRFIGPVVWRQKWQTFDGVTATNTSIPALEASFGYVFNVHRIFGEDNPLPDRADAELDGYLLRAVYGALPFGTLEGYAYLLDYDNPASFAFSTQTYGLRLDGSRAFGTALRALYALEYAHQWDFGDNANGDLDEDYLLAEAGLSFAPGKIVTGVTLKLGYELLGGGGDPGDGFRTPLATLHPYQGWADKFLTTPRDGIEDRYVTLGVKILGADFTAVYHDFGSDAGDYDYGTEWDVVLSRSFHQRFTVGLKYAAYSADMNADNRTRNPALATDVAKAWLWVAFKY
jgi:hypothetical protein